MPLITEKINENAQKCHECTFKKVRAQLKDKIDQNSVLYEEANIAVESIMRVSCNVCPMKKDFIKVFGEAPYDYFSKIDIS